MNLFRMKMILMITTVFLLGIAQSEYNCGVGQYYNNKGVCTPFTFTNGCSEYSSDGECNKCEYGYIKDSVVGNCQFKGANNRQCCLKYDFQGRCQQCAEGLYVSENKCQRNQIHGCVAKSNSLCQACGRGYYLNNNKCQKNIIGCELYTNDGSCSKCTDNIAVANNCAFKFILRFGLCLKQKISYTEITNFASKCQKQNAYGCILCQKDYYLDKNKKCHPYQTGCLLYFQGKCQECSDFRGFYLNQETGECKSKYQFYEVENCYQYSTKNERLKCVGCRQGFRLSKNNECISQYNLNVKIQKKCGKGFYLSTDQRCKVQTGNLVKQDENEDYEQEVKEPGCIYQYGKCQYCEEPFTKTKDGKCSIANCMQFQKTSSKDKRYSCVSCRYPFKLDEKNRCVIAYCAKYRLSQCVLCAVGYHLKAQQTCVIDDLNCLAYDQDGNCFQCRQNYFISSSGECMLKESNCITQFINNQEMPICTICAQGFFLNVYNQCQKIDNNCQFYVNGLCKECRVRYFLHQDICFPYTVGCVKYDNVDCVQCKIGYTLYNAECFSLETLGMKLQGQDDNYDFDIYPIDISKSKYYINNLSPVSALNAQFFYSSAYSQQYTNPKLTFDDSEYDNQQKRSNGWKALTNQRGQYAGFRLDQSEEPVTFYALQLEFIEKYKIDSFYLEYTKDGSNWIRVQNRFIVEEHRGNSQNPQYLNQNGIITIYFTGIYASAIRIVVDDYKVWPACRIQFFYYDLLRFRKISNLKSLRYLRESIQSNFVDRLDNQLYINQKYFFAPSFQCQTGEDLACFTGLELCQPRSVSQIKLINQNKQQNGLNSYVSQFYITYSQNGRNFQCFKQCEKITIKESDLNQDQQYQSFVIDFKGQLIAKNVRIYPTQWVGTPKLSIGFDYQ